MKQSTTAAMERRGVLAQRIVETGLREIKASAKDRR
jgi:hypothetical protein